MQPGGTREIPIDYATHDRATNRAIDAHYVHFKAPAKDAFAPPAPRGQGPLTLERFENYLRSLRKGKLGHNVYDPFLDDHCGLSGTTGSVWNNIAALNDAGVEMLTRREVFIGEPERYDSEGIEKHSVLQVRLWLAARRCELS